MLNIIITDHVQELLDQFSYKGSEILMNTDTGSTDTAYQWALESEDWEGDTLQQFRELKQLEEVKE